jgi:hypothetical protein
MLWHHVAGLFGGIALTLWIFSGWLSVDPFRLFLGGSGLQARDVAAYDGAASLPAMDIERLAAASGAGAKRVEIRWAAGRPWVTAQGGGAEERVLDATTLEPARMDEPALLAAASKLLPGAALADVEVLTAPDAYWYELASLPRLPVLRLRFDDAARTWVHLDPTTGRLLGSLDRRGRAYRWFYDLCHKWDLNVLMLNRPAWDLLLWVLSLVGIVTSVSGIYVGWRRLRA